MDLHWLTAPDHEVAAAMAAHRRDSRPRWVPTRRMLLVHVNHCLIIWYLCIAFMTVGVRVDTTQGGNLRGADIRDLIIAGLVLATWLYGTYWLHRWAARPPSPRSRLREWRQTLTALANGFEPQPSRAATFSALITRDRPRVRQYPRFVAQSVEIGNILRDSRRSPEWHYITVTLPAPLPHLVLDAVSNNGMQSDLPGGVSPEQRLSLEGDFDRWFRVYSPAQYGRDALYVLTPDVMVALIDTAAKFNVEIVDDTLVFFAPKSADFGAAATWESIDAVLNTVATRIVTSAQRYLDERVPGQEESRLVAAMRAQVEHPHIPWVAPAPRIGEDGRRLSIRKPSAVVTALWALGWYSLLVLLYPVPGIFAFAGFMSAIDGW